MGGTPSILLKKNQIQSSNIVKKKSPAVKPPSDLEWSVMLRNLEHTDMPMFENTIFIVFTPPRSKYNHLIKYMATKLKVPLYCENALRMKNIDINTINMSSTIYKGCVIIIDMVSDDRSYISTFYEMLSTSNYYIVTMFLKINVYVCILYKLLQYIYLYINNIIIRIYSSKCMKYQMSQIKLH
jgi:hypothetical protein